MDEEVNTEYCSNCKRDIPAINYVMHATHCQRNLMLCKECGEPVPISQQEEHFEENHAQVKCECGELLEKMNLESHKEQDCPRRSVSCQFCELELPFSEMDAHIAYCGSRTEKCEKCDKYVQLKDLDEHVSSGCRLPAKEEKRILPNPEDDSLSLAQADMFFPSRFGEYPGYSPYYRDSYNSSDRREFKRIVETGLGTPPINEPMDGFGFIDNHTFASDVNEYSVFNNGIARRGPPQSASPKTEYDPYDDYHVDGRYGKFGQDYVEDEECPVDDYIGEHRREVIKNMGGIIQESLPTIRSAVIADDTEVDEAMLPCEFCGGLFPMDALILHQSGCQLNSSMQSSTLRFAFTPIQYRRRQAVPPLNSLPEPRPRKDSPTFEQENTVDDDTEGETDTRDDLDHDDTFLPCEFCQELLPYYSLIHHQAICDAAPSSRPPSGIPDKSGPVPQYWNNQRPKLGNSRKPRPIRPVFSKEPTNPYDDYIPEELEDSDPLHDSPSLGTEFVNGISAIKENPRRKISDSERYTDPDSPPLNNSQYSARSGDYPAFPAQATIRNNDLTKKRSIPELPPISKAIIKQNNRREPEFSSSGKQHGVASSKDQRDNAKKSNPGAVAKQRTETRKPAKISGATGSSGKMQLKSLPNNYAQRVNRDYTEQGTRIGAQQSVKPKSYRIPQSTDIQIGSSGPSSRRDMSRSGGVADRPSRANLEDTFSDVQISERIRATKKLSDSNRSSRGREGTSRQESEHGSTVPYKKPSSTIKKIV